MLSFGLSIAPNIVAFPESVAKVNPPDMVFHRVVPFNLNQPANSG